MHKKIYNICGKEGTNEGGNYMAIREKNIWMLMFFLLSGLVIGGLLGEFASRVDSLWWLGYGQEFGLKTPVELDLNIVRLTFGLWFKISVSSIIGMVLALLLYKKI